jgi:peptidoglycan/xylan/chitin deacetylase (PgdA/CDA1 family)
MNNHHLSFGTFLVYLLAACCCSFPQSAAADDPPVVILKLDDFKPGGTLMPDGWQLTSDLLAARQLKASFGMIGKDIVRANSAFCDWVRKQHDSGMIEFWNHGYLHAKRRIGGKEVAEFQDRYNAQLESLDKAQEVGKEKLGFTFTTFGAPYNAVNADTARALQANDDLTLWLYGDPRIAEEGGFTGILLGRSINLETPVHQPNFAAFKEQYDRGDLGSYIVLQGHPRTWASDRSRFRNFVQIIDFLQQQECKFMTPSEYAATLK